MSDNQDRVRIELDVSADMAAEIAACLRFGTDHTATTEAGASALYDLADAIEGGPVGGEPVRYVQG